MTRTCTEEVEPLSAQVQTMAWAVGTGLGDLLVDRPLRTGWRALDRVSFACTDGPPAGTVHDLLADTPLHARPRMCPHLLTQVTAAAELMENALRIADADAVKFAAYKLRDAEYSLRAFGDSTDLKAVHLLYSAWLGTGEPTRRVRTLTDNGGTKAVAERITELAQDARRRLFAAGRAVASSAVADNVATLGVRRHPRAALPAGATLTKAKVAANLPSYENRDPAAVEAVHVIGSRARAARTRPDRLVMVDEAEVNANVSMGQFSAVAWMAFGAPELARKPGKFGDLVAYRAPAWVIDSIHADNPPTWAVLAEPARRGSADPLARADLRAALAVWSASKHDLTPADVPALLASVS